MVFLIYLWYNLLFLFNNNTKTLFVQTKNIEQKKENFSL